MSPERKTDWQRITEVVQNVAPTIWTKIREGSEERQSNKVYRNGYYLSYGGFKNYPPRITIEAELDLPEGDNTNHKSLDSFINNVARSCSGIGFTLKTTIFPSSPSMDSLEKDQVFGKQPEIPYSIRYSLQADREDFVLK